MNSLLAVKKINIKMNSGFSFLAILFSSITILLASCNTTNTEYQDTRTINDLVEHLKNSGLKIDKTMNVRYEAVLANDGIVMVIDGAKAEFYIYEPSIPYQKKKLDYAKKHKSAEVLGIDIPCEVNGKFVMFTYSKHPNIVKVINAFKDFKLNK